MAHFLQHFLGCVPYFLHVPEGVTEYLHLMVPKVLNISFRWRGGYAIPKNGRSYIGARYAMSIVDLGGWRFTSILR